MQIHGSDSDSDSDRSSFCPSNDSQDFLILNTNPEEQPIELELGEDSNTDQLYELTWNDPEWRYWRDDGALGVEWFENRLEKLLPVLPEQPLEAEPVAEVLAYDVPASVDLDAFAQLFRSQLELNSPPPDLSQIEELIGICEGRDSERYAAQLPLYLAVAPMSLTFLQFYNDPPQWEVLEAFFKTCKDALLSSSSHQTSGSNRFAYSPHLLVLYPIGMLKRSQLKQRLDKKGVKYRSAQVAYWLGVPQAYAVIEFTDESTRHPALEVLLEEFAPIKVEPLPLDSSLRIPFWKRDTMSRPTDWAPAVHMPQTQRMSRKAQLKSERETFLANLKASMPADISTLPLYIIDFEAAVGGPGFSIPTEVFVVEYTMRKGVHRRYHQFIHPGLIEGPFGPPAKKITMEIPPTGIPYKNFSLANYDYAAIWAELIDILPVDGVIVAKGINTEKECLNWLAARVGVINPYQRIVDFGDLLLVWSRMLGFKHTNEQLVEMQRVCNKFIFDDTRCDYHFDMLDHPDGPYFHCARADVMSYCFALNHLANREFAALMSAEVCEQRMSEGEAYRGHA
eukprot:NODE_882_length_1792_cov_25.847447_g826_i0.p1 GENE.NODE_882_length_1792_cov_25.847447_g826_i0~~NODE_882_length_1792_cov_25.847447_g826_i0.p1  ORF type:complete len:583 (+),score=175.18 NODE_882_length_1792_cov_25.847447_g826_i0:56-1750(+)